TGITNEKETTEIFRILTPITQDQFTEIRAAFGMRTYNTTSKNQMFWLWQDPVFLNLPTWLKNELSPDAYATLKSRYPKHL
ncbi:hypothetical protein RZS08_20220, partial [Arthrospira platensis SPKY1]|nr:hypothetical protein [Arthrospira platensis SPKY1]